MTTTTLRRVAAGLLIATAMVASACTPRDAVAVAQHFGINLSTEDAGDLSTYYTANPDEAAAVIEDLQASACTSPDCVLRDVFGQHSTWARNAAWCESSMNPAARNGSHYGLLQIAVNVHAARIARLGYKPVDMLKARPNAVVARDIFTEQGTAPWKWSRHCWG